LKAAGRIHLLTLNFKAMKRMKMSLANIEGKLSRAEMKSIMAGSGYSCLGCTTDQECKDVNKGKCTKECQSGTKGCSGW
jgi:hypothetical protein